ncbi:MAG: hypothetical protein QOJ67_799 [Acidimicrobiaceae bacterium]|jgi:hypothetical protein
MKVVWDSVRALCERCGREVALVESRRSRRRLVLAQHRTTYVGRRVAERQARAIERAFALGEVDEGNW